jgi:hypothetical protein
VGFLVKKRSLFDLSVEERKRTGIHTKMSKIIKARNPSQCRSHHQKMLVRFGSVDAIIDHFKDLLVKKKDQLENDSWEEHNLGDKEEPVPEQANGCEEPQAEGSSNAKEEEVSEASSGKEILRRKSAFERCDPQNSQDLAWNVFFNPFWTQNMWNMPSLWQN